MWLSIREITNGKQERKKFSSDSVPLATSNLLWESNLTAWEIRVTLLETAQSQHLSFACSVLLLPSVSWLSACLYVQRDRCPFLRDAPL